MLSVGGISPIRAMVAVPFLSLLRSAGPSSKAMRHLGGNPCHRFLPTYFTLMRIEAGMNPPTSPNRFDSATQLDARSALRRSERYRNQKTCFALSLRRHHSRPGDLRSSPACSASASRPSGPDRPGLLRGRLHGGSIASPPCATLRALLLAAWPAPLWRVE